jgi:hypothetical protein
MCKQKHLPTTEAIIFMNSPVSARSLSLAKRFGAVIIEYEMGRLEPEYINKYHPSSVRWVLFHQFMQQLEEEGSFGSRHYDKVMFSDVRDAVFTEDPFRFLPANKSYVFQEGPGKGTSIGSCGWNSGWIKDCMGQRTLDRLKDKPVICSGVSMFSYTGSLKYLKLMSSILLGTANMGEYFPACEHNGVDQGVHNAVIHLGLMPGLEVKTEENFPLVNIQSSKMFSAAGITLDSIKFQGRRGLGNRIIGGNPMAVIHQYDRARAVAAELVKKYVFWKDYKDVLGLWKQEPLCQSFNTVVGTDLFNSLSSSYIARVFSVEQCCGMCLDMKSECNTFTYTNGMYYFRSYELNMLPEAQRNNLIAADESLYNWRKPRQPNYKPRLDELILSVFLSTVP